MTSSQSMPPRHWLGIRWFGPLLVGRYRSRGQQVRVPPISFPLISTVFQPSRIVPGPAPHLHVPISPRLSHGFEPRCPDRVNTNPNLEPQVYTKLNPHWAGTLLGLVQVAIIPIPVVFYRYGHKIRMKSALIRSLQRDKEKLESKRRSGGGVRSEKKAEDGDGMVKVSSRIV